MRFCDSALGCPGFAKLGETAVLEAVIFNTRKDKFINETARAFLRHAVGQ